MLIVRRERGYTIAVPDGTLGPTKRLVWIRLIPGTNQDEETGKHPILGRIEMGGESDGMIVIEEENESFEGHVGQLALVAITSEDDTLAYGRLARLVRIFPGYDDREILVRRIVLNADNAVVAQKTLRKVVTRVIQTSAFRPKVRYQNGTPYDEEDLRSTNAEDWHLFIDDVEEKERKSVAKRPERKKRTSEWSGNEAKGSTKRVGERAPRHYAAY